MRRFPRVFAAESSRTRTSSSTPDGLTRTRHARPTTLSGSTPSGEVAGTRSISSAELPDGNRPAAGCRRWPKATTQDWTNPQSRRVAALISATPGCSTECVQPGTEPERDEPPQSGAAGDPGHTQVAAIHHWIEPLAKQVRAWNRAWAKVLDKPGTREKLIAFSAINRANRLAAQRLRGLVMAGAADSSTRSGAAARIHYLAAQGGDFRIERPVRALLDALAEHVSRREQTREWVAQQTRREHVPERLVDRVASTVVLAAAPPAPAFGQGRVGMVSAVTR